MTSIQIRNLPAEIRAKLKAFSDQLPAVKPSGPGDCRDALSRALEEAMRREVARRRLKMPGPPSRLTRVVDDDVASALDRLRGPGEALSAAVLEAIRHL